jgi:hypothetical protein
MSYFITLSPQVPHIMTLSRTVEQKLCLLPLLFIEHEIKCKIRALVAVKKVGGEDFTFFRRYGFL